MTLERWILLAAWVLCALIMLFAVPKHRFREALLLLFSNQVITWSLSLLFVEAGMIENPVREFPIATRANFTFNFVLYPTLSMLFGLYYPLRGSRGKQLLYQAGIITGIASCLTGVVLYTQLIEFPRFNWLLGCLVLLFGFNGSRKFVLWYLKGLPQKGG